MTVVFGAHLLEGETAAAAAQQKLSHSFPHNCAGDIRTLLSFHIDKEYVWQNPDTLERIPQTGTFPETTCQPSCISVGILTLTMPYKGLVKNEKMHLEMLSINHWFLNYYCLNEN